jgi:hypothetical protein
MSSLLGQQRRQLCMSAGPRLRSISFLVKGSSYFAFRLVLCDATQSCLAVCHAVEVVRVELGAHQGEPLLVMLTEHRCNSRRLCYFRSIRGSGFRAGALFAGMDRIACRVALLPARLP